MSRFARSPLPLLLVLGACSQSGGSRAADGAIDGAGNVSDAGAFERTEASSSAADGGRDRSFDPTCVVDDAPSSSGLIAMTPAKAQAYPVLATEDDQGRPYVVGVGPGTVGEWVFASRLTADGHADPGYGDSGIARVTPEGLSYYVELAADAGPNGTLLIAFGTQTAWDGGNVILMRLLASGALDTSFGSGGFAPMFDKSTEVITNNLDKIALAVAGDSAYVFANVQQIMPENPLVPTEQKIVGRRLNAMTGVRDPDFRFETQTAGSFGARSLGGHAYLAVNQRTWRFRDGELDVSFGDAGHSDSFPLGGSLSPLRGIDELPDGRVLAPEGANVIVYDPNVDHSAIVGTFGDGVEARMIRRRCDGRAVVFVLADGGYGAALLTDGNAPDPDRLITHDFDEDPVKSVWPFSVSGTTGRVTIFARDVGGALFAVSLTP